MHYVRIATITILCQSTILLVDSRKTCHLLCQ